MAEQISGMRGTGSFDLERGGDFRQKIKNLASRKKKKGGVAKPTKLSRPSLDSKFEPDNSPQPSLRTREDI